MTIRRQDSAHIFSVAESFSNYSQDQDPMSSFVIGTKITVLWCTKCYYHDADDDDGGDGWWGCEAMIFRANDKIGMEARGCFRAVPLTAGASTDDSKVSPLPSPFLLTHRAPPLSGSQQPGKLFHQLALVGCFVFSFWGSLYLRLWLSEGISVEHKSTSLEDISADNLPRSRPRAHHCWRVLASTESSDGHNPQGCLGYTQPGSEMCLICGDVFPAAECSPPQVAASVGRLGWGGTCIPSQQEWASLIVWQRSLTPTSVFAIFTCKHNHT